jgi:hypothetical protein
VEHYKERNRTVHSVGPVNDEKLHDPRNMANAFNNVFITITEKTKY